MSTGVGLGVERRSVTQEAASSRLVAPANSLLSFGPPAAGYPLNQDLTEGTSKKSAFLVQVAIP